MTRLPEVEDLDLPGDGLRDLSAPPVGAGPRMTRLPEVEDLNLPGDGLRDLSDPRLARVRA